MFKNFLSVSSKSQRGSVYVVLVIFVFLIVGFTFFTASHYIVKTSDGVKFYPKEKLSFNDSYVDMTSVTFIELRHHQGLVASMFHKNDIEYLPGGRALIKAKQAGMEISQSIKKFDSEYQVTSSLNNIARIGHNKYQKLEVKHGISGKVQKSKEIMKKQAKKINSWLEKK